MEIDNNKLCNLGICLMKQGRLEEARVVLRNVSRPAVAADKKGNSEAHNKSYERAQQLLKGLETSLGQLILTKRPHLLCTQLNNVEEIASETAPCCHQPEQVRQQYATAQVRDCEVSNHCNKAVSEIREMSGMVAAVADAWMLNTAWPAQEEEEEEEYDGDPTKGSMEFSMSQMQRRSDIRNSRRRLPVFQDLTILGNA